jgi:hypothetical protein
MASIQCVLSCRYDHLSNLRELEANYKKQLALIRDYRRALLFRINRPDALPVGLLPAQIPDSQRNIVIQSGSRCIYSRYRSPVPFFLSNPVHGRLSPLFPELFRSFRTDAICLIRGLIRGLRGDLSCRPPRDSNPRPSHSGAVKKDFFRRIAF